jgi:hypothetical protein
VQVSVLLCKRPFPKTSFAYATRSGQAAREGNSELLEARTAFTGERAGDLLAASALIKVPLSESFLRPD